MKETIHLIQKFKHYRCYDNLTLKKLNYQIFSNIYLKNPMQIGADYRYWRLVSFLVTPFTCYNVCGLPIIVVWFKS